MKLRVGVVGLGRHWKSRYAPALAALADRFEVRAIHTDVGAMAEQAARRLEAHAVDGFRALVERPDIDAVLLLAADWRGPLPALAACEAGKAIYCVPELAIDPSRGRALKERVDRSGVAFVVEFARRQSPASVRLKELIATRLGAPQVLFCEVRRPVEERSRGVSSNLQRTRRLIEIVDWCRYLIDREPTSVVGIRQSATGADEPNFQMISLDFSDPGSVGIGPLAQIHAQGELAHRWREAAAFRRPPELQMVCERGIAFVDLPTSLVWFDEAGQHTESLESDLPAGEQLLMQFHRAVTSLLRRSRHLEDLHRGMQIVEAAEESFRHAGRVQCSG